MFSDIEIPYGSKMLYNELKVKPGVDEATLQLALGELCSVVNSNYGNKKGGFIGGQVFRFSGFVSPAGTVNSDKNPDNHIAIITYWNSFEHHEASHDDDVFKDKFKALSQYCEETLEKGYEMLWQGSALASE